MRGSAVKFGLSQFHKNCNRKELKLTKIEKDPATKIEKNEKYFANCCGPRHTDKFSVNSFHYDVFLHGATKYFL